MNRRNLLKMLPGLCVVPLFGSESRDWIPTEKEVKDIFRNAGFHVCDTNMKHPVALYNKSRKDIYDDSYIPPFRDDNWAVEAGSMWVMTEKSLFINEVDLLRNKLDYNVFSFYRITRIEDIKIEESGLSKDGITQTFLDNLRKNKIRFIVRGAWFKV